MSEPGGSPPVVAIVGPTAVGKTAAAMAVAERIGAEIVSADSMAVYRGFDIGTAKPTAEERRRVRFHAIDIAEPSEALGVAQFREQALAAIGDISARGLRAVVCGGSGLYVRALLDGMGMASVPAQAAIRERLRRDAGEFGVPALHARLARVDPEAASRIHPNDLVRIERALEVYEATGVPISEQQRIDRETRVALPAARFGLRMPMAVLDARIDARVDAMFRAGLADEVRALAASGIGPGAAPMSGLGYKEALARLLAGDDPAFAADDIKRNTRRFARRQMTWFRADRRIQWLDVEGKTLDDVADWIVAGERESVDRPFAAPQS